MDEGGERESETRRNFCAERRIKLHFQGVGDHPWLMERRNGLARGICHRLIEDDRFMNKTILAEVRWRPNSMLSASGFSAHHMVFGSHPVDLFGLEHGREDMMFARDTSPAGQFLQRWKLRMKALERNCQ